MQDQFVRPWNVLGKTWIPVEVPGPWAVDNSLSNSQWGVINTDTGATKVIGKVSMRGTNYFDKSYEEATRRNYALLQAFEISDLLAQKIIADNPDICLATDSVSRVDEAAKIVGRLLEIAGSEFPNENPERRDALVAKVVSYRNAATV